ncbi:MAG TPA: DUF2189 domain-containing protein [Burkholderiaceae bacterium]|nr:DUF2189 domain-containing protein [Burkholderiaceae bacterium]HQR71838.1 DUF2189 domain-containing protein [Burkholderiaceae bacterium]
MAAPTSPSQPIQTVDPDSTPDSPDEERGSPFPPIRSVPASAPFGWLARGWSDLCRAPAASLAYGAIFALMGWLVAFVFRLAYEYTSALSAGFLLVGPFLATGLYDISRRLQRGERVRFSDTTTAWRENLGAFSLFSLVLTIIMLVWARASLITFALFFSGGMPTLQSFLAQVVSIEHVDFLVTYFAVGALFAAIVFAVSVVSVPMMLDRGTDTIVAALTSVRALFTAPLTLLVWALLIVLVIGAGFATFFIGLVVAVPVVGHATWHAYRSLVAEGVRDGSAIARAPSTE